MRRIAASATGLSWSAFWIAFPCCDFSQREAPLDFVVRAYLSNALCRIMADEAQPGRLFEDRVQHSDCAAGNAGATGSYATAALPGFSRFAGYNICLEAFDVSQGQALNLPVSKERANVRLNPAAIESQRLPSDRPAAATEQFTALGLFEIPVADIRHCGGGARSALFRDGICSVSNAA